MPARWKVAFGLAVVLLAAGAAYAQPHPVEIAFDRKKAIYKLHRDQEINEPWPGDKTSTNFDYLYYTSGDDLVKIRIVESSVSEKKVSSIKVDDYFFVDGKLRLVRLYFFISGQRMPLILKGGVVPLLTGEHMEFAEGEMIKWSALGKQIPKSDQRWSRKQSSVMFTLSVERNRFDKFLESRDTDN